MCVCNGKRYTWDLLSSPQPWQRSRNHGTKSIPRMIGESDIHLQDFVTNILYLSLDLDSTTTKRRKNDLVTSGNLQRNMVAFLVQCTLTNGKNNSLVGSFLSLLRDKDTRGSFLWYDPMSTCKPISTIDKSFSLPLGA